MRLQKTPTPEDVSAINGAAPVNFWDSAELRTCVKSGDISPTRNPKVVQVHPEAAAELRSYGVKAIGDK